MQFGLNLVGWEKSGADRRHAISFGLFRLLCIRRRLVPADGEADHLGA